jgi:hypothetical protein
MVYKPRWACANCGMDSSRKYSVKRHITNLHSGQGVLISYIDYIIGRQKGNYPPSAPPNFVNRPKPEIVLAPRKTYDVMEEEFWREIARQAVRKLKS